MLHLSWTRRNSFAWFHMCLSGSGAVSEVVRAALVLGQSGQGCASAALLMALGSSLSTFSVGERTLLHLHPLLTEDNLFLVHPHL